MQKIIISKLSCRIRVFSDSIHSKTLINPIFYTYIAFPKQEVFTFITSFFFVSVRYMTYFFVKQMSTKIYVHPYIISKYKFVNPPNRRQIFRNINSWKSGDGKNVNSPALLTSVAEPEPSFPAPAPAYCTLTQ